MISTPPLSQPISSIFIKDLQYKAVMVDMAELTLLAS